MSLHVKLALLQVLLQLYISLILGSSQLQHRLSHIIKCIFQSSCVQCYLGDLCYNWSYRSRVSLGSQWSSSSRVSRMLSISRGSSIIRGSSSLICIPSFRISSILIISSIQWSSILTLVPSSFRGPLISI